MSGQSTEETIKEAARKLFHEKGFEGTKTRDIADAAGINLALLNYYFRSKKKLYDLIMVETIQDFFSKMLPILNQESTGLREKIAHFVEEYINMLQDNPDIPAFILNEARRYPETFMQKLGILAEVKNSHFFRQYLDAGRRGAIPAIHPVHFILNLMGLLVFPFVARPLVQTVTGVPTEVFAQIIEERKKLIPLWLNAMMEVSPDYYAH